MTALYNRYVPQADGSFLKTKVQSSEDPQKCYGQEEIPQISCRKPEYHQNECSHNAAPLGKFFRNLLPHNLDTEDLIVILLLLLLSQDGGKNGNRAMLTLGAYLFL